MVGLGEGFAFVVVAFFLVVVVVVTALVVEVVFVVVATVVVATVVVQLFGFFSHSKISHKICLYQFFLPSAHNFLWMQKKLLLLLRSSKS